MRRVRDDDVGAVVRMALALASEDPGARVVSADDVRRTLAHDASHGAALALYLRRGIARHKNTHVRART